MSQPLLAIQNILQNSNIFDKSRETVLFTPFGDKKVTQFSGFLATSVSYLKGTSGITHKMSSAEKERCSRRWILPSIISTVFEVYIIICTDVTILVLQTPLVAKKVFKILPILTYVKKA